MMDTLDGDYQAMKANDGAFVRKNFFGRHPKLLEMVAKMSDDDIWRLQRGGHDPQKVYAAYHKAVNTTGQPTVMLIKTVKGFGMGKAGEGKNTAHQAKKLTDEDIKTFRDRFNIPIPDSELAQIPFYKPADDTPEMRYLHERRQALGGYLPKRRTKAEESLPVPDLSFFQSVLEPTAEGREISTTQAYVRFLTAAAARQATGPAHRAHPGGRGPHLRHGRPVPPDRHLQPGGAAVHAAGPRPGDRTTRKTRRARSCKRASTRPAAWAAGSPRPPRTRRTTG
jgi:pyruvate dehydrogenase E1 component